MYDLTKVFEDGIKSFQYNKKNQYFKKYFL